MLEIDYRSIVSKFISGLLLLFGCLSFLAIIKTIFISIDIDESYAVSQAFRLVQGDRLVADMWEPHQFSAYLTALLLKLHLFLVGSTDYVIITLRLMGTLIHLLLGYGLFRILRNWCDSKVAAFLVLLHINFLAKWIQLPEFELMHYWLLLLTALCFFQYFEKKDSPLLLICAGVSMMLQLLNYPTMILLYPFYMLGIFCLQNTGHSKGKAALITTLSAIIPGVGFIIYLLSYQSLAELVQNISYILADPSHTQQNFWWRMGVFGKEFLWDILLLTAVTAGSAVLLFLYYKITCMDRPAKHLYLLQTVLLAFVLLCIGQMFGCLFLNRNQFFLQERYLLLILPGIGLYLSDKARTPRRQLLFWFGLVPAIVSTIAAALLTNMSMNVSYSKLFLGCLFTFMMLNSYLEETERQMIYAPLLFLLCSLLVCKLLLIRVTGCLPVTVRAPLELMESGPLKGVYVLEDFATSMEANQKLLEQYVSKEDNLFLFGCESLLYVGSDARISVASVQGTSVFNQDFLDYLAQHPEKYPTVIAVDKRFRTVAEYRYNPWNYIVADWISSKSVDAEAVETDYMTLYIFP